jgi:hypothetical protein
LKELFSSTLKRDIYDIFMMYKINFDMVGVEKNFKKDLITEKENEHWKEVANLVK